MIFYCLGEFHQIPKQSSSNLGSLVGNNGTRLSYEQTVATLSSTELMRHSGEIAMKDACPLHCSMQCITFNSKFQHLALSDCHNRSPQKSLSIDPASNINKLMAIVI